MIAGFSGGLVVDYPNSTKAKKTFLCLFAGTNYQLPQPLDNTPEEQTTISYSSDRNPHKRQKISKNEKTKGRNWIVKKKEHQRKQGKTEVRPDTKHTGRPRRF